jgi:hypothetical protein
VTFPPNPGRTTEAFPTNLDERYRNAWRLGCPIPTNLADAEVGTWVIGDTPEGREPPAADYKALLESDPHMRRSTYRSVEQWLRNRGYEGAANEVYRDMWRRLTAEPSSAAARSVPVPVRQFARFAGRLLSLVWHGLGAAVGLPISWLWNHMVWPHWLRYGTDPLPLLGIVVLLAFLSYPVYRHPGNIEPSAGRLAIDSQHDTMPFAMFGVSPGYGDWGVEDGLALLVRTNAAFLPFRMRDEWSLRDSGGIDYDFGVYFGRVCRPAEAVRASQFPTSDLPGCFRIGWWTAEGFGALMSILNLLMWPLILASAVRRMLRQ